MKLLKPAWVSHDDLPIFSVDIHPDGSRFATGGQGEDSGRIIIWNMAPVVSEEVENDENVPKMLCQMDNHLACVNCVRWSFSGKFLASGGDDKMVMIWKISKYPSGGAFGAGGKSGYAESWRCVTTLHGHGGDVLDMAWSPHDAWLASCSVDNTVIVWNALKLPEIVAVLRGHKGLVKGVTWDPVGKYMASQSDDKTLRVWRTADWQQDAVIHEPFDECGGTTHVLRLSWSPDGQYLVSAHAMNGGGPTAQIIEREGWRQDKDFVGHRKAVTCVRFNSNILQKQYRQSSKPQQYCCCAIGSRDCSLSVWLTALKRPLVVLHELFTSSVLDLSWSYTGLQLMACSWDGSVAFVEFSQEELGKPLSLDEKNVLHERMYGMSLSTAKPQATIVETPEVLAVQEKEEPKTESTAVTVERHSNSGGAQPQPLTPHKGPINCQIETRTTDGKRRITPMFIPPAPDSGEGPAPFGSGTTQTPAFLSSSESRSSIVIKRRDDVVDPNVSRTPGKSSSKEATNTPAITNGTAPTRLDQAAIDEAEPVAKVSIAGTQITIKTPSVKKPYEKSTMSELKNDLQKAALKRKFDKDMKLGSKTPPHKRLRLVMDDKGPPQSSANEPIAAQLGMYSEDEQQGVLTLPSLPILNNYTISIADASSSLYDRHRLEVKNNALTSPYGSLSKLKAYSNPESPSTSCMPSSANYDVRPVWEAMVGSTVCGCAANQYLSVAVCTNATLHIFSTSTGQRLLSPLVLAAPASRIAVGPGRHIMTITVAGGVSVWEIGVNPRCIIKNESLEPLMADHAGLVVTIMSSVLTENGCPLITLSSGKAYMFSVELGSWLMIADATDPIFKCSATKSFQHLIPINDSTVHPLACVQSQMRHPPMSLNIRQTATAQLGPICTVTYLEHQLSACEALDSRKEYRNWLLILARVLVQEGLESRLRILCNDLLGPAHAHAKSSKSWQSTIMGHSKHELLREILGFMSSNLNLQRLFTEYNDQLSIVEEMKPSVPNGVPERCTVPESL